MSSEKSLESASSAGLGVPGRQSSSSTTIRPRANTGYSTPQMMGLGVPAKKVVTSGKALERKEASKDLRLVPGIFGPYTTCQ